MGNHWHDPNRIKTCTMCGEGKPLSEFSACAYTTQQGKRSTRYESRCKPCNAKRRMARYRANPEKEKAVSQAWKNKNRDRIAEYTKSKRQDPEYKRMKAKAQRARKARIKASSDNKDPRIRDLYQQALDWEKKLQQCICSDDELDLKVHVDHIIPLAKGGKHVFENLQLLDARLNLQKGVSHSAGQEGL